MTQPEQSATLPRPPLTELDYVRMWLSMSEHQPGQGHYTESRACRRMPSNGVKDCNSRCTRCDGEALLRDAERKAQAFPAATTSSKDTDRG